MQGIYHNYFEVKNNNNLRIQQKIIIMDSFIGSQEAPDINKNGSFCERRKMYPLFALHNLKSSIPIEWNAQQRRQEQNRLAYKQKIEHEHITKEYNNKIQRQLMRRYNQNLSTFRVLMQDYDSNPNQNNKEILEHQLQNFNTSKDLSSSHIKNNPQNIKLRPQNSNDPHEQYYYAQRHPIQNQQIQNKYNNYAHSDKNESQQRYNHQNPNSPNLYNYKYSQDLPRSYKKYPDLYHGNGVEFYQYPFKNLMPDRLQEFLRQKTKIDNKKTLNFSRINSINHKRQKSL